MEKIRLGKSGWKQASVIAVTKAYCGACLSRLTLSPEEFSSTDLDNLRLKI